jgi:sarcosine oxidase
VVCDTPKVRPIQIEAAAGDCRFPIFILERGPNDLVYGFPSFEERGVKAAPHNHGPVVGPDDWDDPPATDDELRSVGEALAELVPHHVRPDT